MSNSRLSEPAAPELVQTAYARELADTAILYGGMSRADLAHTVMLVDAGVIPREAGGQLLHALLAAHPEPPLDFARDASVGDLYSNRETYLAMHTPRAGHLSTGRARREAIAVAYRLAVRDWLLQLAGALIACIHAASELARTHTATLFPDYTYLQTAQPTTFGHYLLTFAYPMLRDLERLRGAYARTNVSPAGCGGTNGSRLPLDREELAQLLGFDAIIVHARDAMWQADGPIEVAALASAALVNLDRLAEDLQIFATQEFALVELADRHARASKIMPQKKNPYSLTYVRGVTGETLGALAAMAAIGKTPSGQPDNRMFAHGAVPRVLEQATGAAQLMAGVLGGLTVNVERAAQRAAAGFSGATDLAEVIMQQAGLDYRTAHQIVAHAVRAALDGGQSEIDARQIASSSEAAIGTRIDLHDDTLKATFDPAAVVATRTGPGGAAEDAMASMLAEVSQTLAEHATWRETSQLKLEQADAMLQLRAASLAIAPDATSVTGGGSGQKTMGDVLGDPFSAGEAPKTMGDLLNEMPEPDWRRRHRR